MILAQKERHHGLLQTQASPSPLTSQTQSLPSSSNLFLWPALELLCLRGSLLYCSEESWNDRLGWLQILESSCSCKWIKADWNPILGCCHCRFSCNYGFTLWLWLRAAVISSLPSAPLNPISFCRHSISATTFHLLWFSLKINHTIHARGDPMSFLGTLTPFALNRHSSSASENIYNSLSPIVSQIA